MIDPKRYVVGPDATIQDVDLATEVVVVGAVRLTDEGAAALTASTLAAARRANLLPGRKSLTGGTVHSPKVQFRVPESLAVKAESRAKAEGTTVSALAREALERYLAS